MFIDDNKRFIVKVIGIFIISDEIIIINIFYLFELFGLLDVKFYCWKGYVDLLIGIDYVYMYIGDIR